MVVFACNACGASVKKNQVEKHYTQQCRRCESLSCMDCGKDFWGEDYKHHVKCISEDQKYAAKGWQPKPSANKGERKQEAWIEAINSAVDETKDMTPQLRQLLSTLTQYSNIPRKKKKFENFVGNSVHVRNPALVEQAWRVFEKALVKPQENQKPANKDDAATALNGSASASAEPVENGEKSKEKKKQKTETEELESDTGAKEHKKSKREKKMELSKKMAKANGNALGNGDVTSKKKRKADDIEEFDGAVQKDEEGAPKKKKKKNQQRDEVPDAGVERLNATLDESALMEVHSEGRFDWRGVVLSVLGGSGEGELPLKKLRKKVVNEFQARGCEGRLDLTREQIWAKLDKKLKKMTQVKVLKDNVKLVSA